MNQIGKYRIIKELGKGGMGTVYQAEDTVIGRTVALKIIKDEVSDDAELKERFFREAKWAGGLSHPNITVVYDVGEYPIAIDMRDLDGDDDLDLVTANRSDNTISVLLNNGDGTYAPHVTYDTGDLPQYIAIADAIVDRVKIETLS